MKTLHALVSYLAVTTLSFAFASPLAVIDYDGFVNTTQNHIDDALMKRVPGDIIEARQFEFPAVFLTISIIVDVVLSINFITKDDSVRGNDVDFLVEHFD